MNIAEIELAVLSNMCLTQRIPDKDHLRREVEANINARNAKAAPVNWRFTSQDARRKMARLYPRFSAWLTTRRSSELHHSFFFMACHETDQA